MPNVKAIRRELALKLQAYRVIFDAIEGELQIKGYVDSRPYGLCGGVQVSYQAGTLATFDRFQPEMAKRYLPVPNCKDANEQTARYNSYVKRAVWYGFTGNTLEAMIGEIFKRDPIIELPTRLEPMKANADGASLDLIQLSKRAVRHALPYSRGGVFTDYTAKGTATIADLNSGKAQAIMKVYAPWDIINWRTTKNDEGKTILSLVVLRDIVDSDTDEFETRPLEQYRALRLVNGQYQIETWKVDEKNEKESTLDKTVVPKDSTGKPFNEIPFSFIGGENNDADVDRPLMYDLASLNVAHYRNSADYEESCFLVGQPTPVAAGLTEEWVKNVFKDGEMELGSRAVITLPVGATAALLQADPNAMTKDAMEHKERQAVSIGAKLVQDKQVMRTATDALMESAGQASSLANVAVNVSVAFVKGLKWAAMFVGDDPAKVKFELNTQFELMNMSADDQSKLVAAWQRGGICWEEMRVGLRKAGTATMPDAEAKAAIQKEQADLVKMGAIADPFGHVNQPANPTNNPKGQQATATKAAVKGSGA
jgi:hypothetical protein